jgi:hypothetical protein
MKDKASNQEIGHRKLRVVIQVDINPEHDIRSEDVVMVVEYTIKENDLKGNLAEFIGVKPKDLGYFKMYVAKHDPDWMPNNAQAYILHKKYQALKRWYKEKMERYALEKGMAEVDAEIAAKKKQLQMLAEEMNRRETYLIKNLRPTKK